MKVDLGKQLVFTNIIHTNGHSYMVTKWQETGEGGAVPWEARCKEAYERKMAKYTEL